MCPLVRFKFRSRFLSLFLLLFLFVVSLLGFCIIFNIVLLFYRFHVFFSLFPTLIFFCFLLHVSTSVRYCILQYYIIFCLHLICSFSNSSSYLFFFVLAFYLFMPSLFTSRILFPLFSFLFIINIFCFVCSTVLSFLLSI